MTNPFQARSSTTLKRRAQRKPSRRSAWLALSAASLTAVIVLWLAGQWGWMPQPFQRLLSITALDQSIHLARPGLSLTQSRALYREALEALGAGDSRSALEQFKRLEGVYPGLSDIIRLHQAEAYALEGNEWAVQKKLSAILERTPGSALRAVTLYRIGQSQFRGGEWEKAQATFERVRREFPNQDYATGSLYYLGAILAKQPDKQAQAAQYLREYLQDCPDCKFSGDSAEQLARLLDSPTPEDHALIGLGMASAGKDLDTTLSYLEKGPRAMTWMALGQSQIRAGEATAGVQTLMDGLPHAQDPDTAQAAVDLILSKSPHPKAVLSQLQSKNLNPGGDYILWRLADTDAPNAATYYQAILRQFPDSDYAPESGWNLLWPLLAQGRTDRFLTQAGHYLDRYPYARSAPKVLFWTGKLQEKSAPSEAIRAYRHLVRQYPDNYYAFRAAGRLNVLAEHQPDPGWPTLPNRPDYPQAQTDFAGLNLLPPETAFGEAALGKHRRAAARELQAIGAAGDLKLLVTEATGSLPPAIESWAYHVSGERAKALRTIRDALELQNREAFKAADGQPIKPAGTPDEFKLLYPVYFERPIALASRKNKLDPYLIQSLMREESYFNEFAISTSNARGLMQLLPSTAQEVAGWEKMAGFKTADLFLPEVNVRLGSRYLAFLHQQFSGNSMPAVGAYNGGPGAMKRWVQASHWLQTDPDMFVERIPYAQSRDYIKKVFTSYWNYQRLYAEKGSAEKG